MNEETPYGTVVTVIAGIGTLICIVALTILVLTE